MLATEVRLWFVNGVVSQLAKLFLQGLYDSYFLDILAGFLLQKVHSLLAFSHVVSLVSFRYKYM